MNLIKGMLFGAVLTWVFCLVVGSQGSAGGFLYIHPVEIEASKLHINNVHNFTYYWSWPLFLAGTGLSWAILVMLD